MPTESYEDRIARENREKCALIESFIAKHVERV